MTDGVLQGSGTHSISVVVPTYNRPAQLSDVLDHILRSDVSCFSSVEVIVVDDGSPEPALPIIESKSPPGPIQLRCLRQENSGPAEARNNGLRNASNEIVLFVDDDVLLCPDALRRHAVSHDERPDSVIYGHYPYLVPETETPEYRYFQGLIDQVTNLIDDETFVRVDTVASGNLSVQRCQFESGGLYRPGLTIPVAEEYALMADLKEKNIPIFFARDIRGWHLQPTRLKDVCRQNYKYGLGISEVAIKMPSVLELEQLRLQFDHNRGPLTGDNIGLKFKKTVARFASIKPVRVALRLLAESLGKIGLPDAILFRFYRTAISSYATAGVRDGINLFRSGTNQC